MNKQLLFLSLAAAALFAGCARTEIDGGGQTASATHISAKANGQSDILLDTKAPVTGSSMNGLTADVYASTYSLSGHTGDIKTTFSQVYAYGTMTFDDAQYVIFDKAGFGGKDGGNSILPQDGREVYLYGFYPRGWERKTAQGGNAEALCYTFDGKTDVMSTWLDATQDLKIKYNDAPKPDKADFIFKHLLTRYNIQIKASDADAVKEWGRVKSIKFARGAEINNVHYVTPAVGNPLGISFATDPSATTPTSFFKLSGALDAPAYADTKFEVADYASGFALTTAYQNACYSMVAPVTVDATSAEEVTLVVKTVNASGKEITANVPVTLDQTKFTSNGNSTRGFSITLAFNFRVGVIQATAIVEQWKDYGIQYEEVDLPKPTTPNPPAASDIVTIDGLQWTKGNLVAKNTNECQVGAPGDYGVYFQFGSLVGWQGGATGDGTGVTNTGLGVAVQVKPSTYVGTDAWTTVGRYLGGTTDDTGYGLPATDAPTTGIGDPCRFYLGAPWRTPTAGEYKTLFANVNDGTAWGSVSGWNWQASPAGAIGPSSLFFPASGHRGTSSGSFYSVTTAGYYWSSSVYDATYGLSLYFGSSWVRPQDATDRSYGFPVRCVSSVP